MNKIRKLLLLALLTSLTSLTYAHDLVVQNAWARFSVAGMSASGVFLDIDNQSKQDDVLVAVSTPVAGKSEIHESVNHEGMMHMHALPEGLALPAHQTTHLQPGSMHIMLMDLKQPLKQGTTIPLTLMFKHSQSLNITVPVKTGNGQGHKMH
ncbi:copper chaperone PCu(A)C [Neisseriaceae bacterium ESL0693]|nr:copper chaperone PCu(A)C [Neisseriaceae bacterium ESL0693]